MALGRYRVNATVTLTPGAFTAAIFGTGGGTQYGTGSNANAANNWGSGAGTPGGGPAGSYQVPAGQIVVVDPTAPLGVALGGAGNLTAVTPGQETGGFYGTAN